MSQKLTALIPVHNDDYALDFCLHSIVGHFDEIVVLDDCSTDHTADIALDVAARHKHVRFMRHEGDQQLGWIEARNRLLGATDSDWLFWLDSDDVLCEYNAHLLKKIAEGPDPIVRLYLTEMWGDFYHTTQRLRHYDKCHTFTNRRRMKEIYWGGGSAACLNGGRVRARNGPGPLFFHIKGVKPDRRLVERQFVRKWMRAGRPGRLEDFAGLDAMGEEEIHRRALKMIFHSKQDHLLLAYVGTRGRERAPRRPRVLFHQVPRFRIEYDGDKPLDRRDRGWTPLSWRPTDGTDD